MADAERLPHGQGDGGRRHFLFVVYGIQSHLNPCRALARSLVQLYDADGSGPVLATLSVPLFTHRRMFPSSGSGVLEENEEATDGVISYTPFSDGVDDGTASTDADERARRRRASFESLSAIVARLAARGRPVTCVVCSLVLSCALDVARAHAIPMAVFWIQPATVLAAYYHYFHGYGELIASHAADPSYEVALPGLCQPLRIRDFPSFLVDATGVVAKVVNDAFRELFDYMDEQGQRTKVLVNTFDELERAALAAMRQHLDVVAVGPVVGTSVESRIHLFDHAGADKKRYMEWLGAQPEMSVVYVSFGSIGTYSKQQMEEIAHGLRRSGRPYLLVVRKDGRQEDVSSCLDDVVQEGQGMVVEWCDQPEVLAHPSVGCFVTHCGWNSTLEAMSLGVPVVAAPTMFDQPTNAFLIQDEWAAGVKGERNGEGVLTGAELARCVELVMGGGARALEIRERVEALKGMAREAVASGGPAERRLRSFVTASSATDKACTKDTTNHVEIDVIKVQNLASSTNV